MPAMAAAPVRREILEVAAEGKGHRGAHQVGPGGGALDGLVAGVVDDISVVADPAGHDVDAEAAVQRVVAAEADQRVVAAEPAQHIGGVVAGYDVGELLPVPAMAAAPVRVRFSTLLPRVKVAEASTASMPAPPLSMARSRVLLTT